MVERFHRQLKATIEAHESPNPWTITLPEVLLGVRSTIKELLGKSADKMIHGTTLRLSGMFTEQYNVDAHTDLDNYFRQATGSHVASPIVPTARHTAKRHFPI